MHVRGPAVTRHRLFGRGHFEGDLGVHERSRRTREQAAPFVRGGDVDVDEVSLFAPADLDADRRDEHQTRNQVGTGRRHLGRHPAAE